MTTPETIPQQPEYEPSLSQLERAKSIRRFNLFYIYLPVSVLSLVVVILVVVLIYIGLNPPTPETLQTLSGIADGVVILSTIPAIIICGIVPLLAIMASVQARRQGMAPIRQLQLLLWRMDRGVGLVKSKVEEVTPMIARPFVNIHAKMAYFKTLFKQIVELFKRG